ncbi:hypothetical protein CLOM621_09057 [Clostridium sp. M62/1]|nr:hypothetical protein CLOM621_09057 [Clostridium sp. M62/1]
MNSAVVNFAILISSCLIIYSLMKCFHTGFPASAVLTLQNGSSITRLCSLSHVWN